MVLLILQNIEEDLIEFTYRLNIPSQQVKEKDKLSNKLTND